MQNARPADNHCKELRVQSVLTFNLHVYRGPRLAHVSPIQCTGPSTSSSTSWSKVTVKLIIFTSGHWQSVSAITSPSPQQWLNPYFGNPDWLSDLNHCCPCFGNPDSPVRYGTRIVFLDWSICKGSPLLMKYDKLFRKSHFVIFAFDKKHKGARTVWPIIVLARGDGGSQTFWQAPPRLPPTPFLPPVSFILACHTGSYLHNFWQLSQPPNSSTIAKQMLHQSRITPCLTMRRSCFMLKNTCFFGLENWVSRCMFGLTSNAVHPLGPHKTSSIWVGHQMLHQASGWSWKVSAIRKSCG